MATARILAYSHVVQIRAPYRRAFVEALKAALPAGTRWWDADEKVWEAERRHLETIVRLARDFYTQVLVDEFDDEEDAGPKRHRRESRGQAHREAPGGANGQAATSPWAALQRFMRPTDYAALRRILAKRYHPDTGGDAAAMTEINQLFDKLGAK